MYEIQVKVQPNYIRFIQGFRLLKSEQKSLTAVYIWSFRQVLKYVITLLNIMRDPIASRSHIFGGGRPNLWLYPQQL